MLLREQVNLQVIASIGLPHKIIVLPHLIRFAGIMDQPMLSAYKEGMRLGNSEIVHIRSLVLHQTISGEQVLGGALILSAVVILQLRGRRGDR